MQVYNSLQTDNHASTPPVSFYRPDPFLLPNQQRQSTAILLINRIHQIMYFMHSLASMLQHLTSHQQLYTQHVQTENFSF